MLEFSDRIASDEFAQFAQLARHPDAPKAFTRKRKLSLRQGTRPSLFLPGAELTLHANVHSAQVAERSMLTEALDVLGPDDVLVLDRSYPAAWLVAYAERTRHSF